MPRTDGREYAFEGVSPSDHETARVSREATVVGDVTVEADAGVWLGVVLRGNVGPVRVGHKSHVGDNAVLHAAEMGERVMIGHGAVLNDTAVADGALVWFNSAVTPLGETSSDPDIVFEAESSGGEADLAHRHRELFNQQCISINSI